MLNHYKIRFTEDRETFKSMVVPANNLTEAYISIQMHFPNAEITEANEMESWAKVIAKHMIDHATVSEFCAFASNLDADKAEELVNAIWDEWHKQKPSKAV